MTESNLEYIIGLYAKKANRVFAEDLAAYILWAYGRLEKGDTIETIQFIFTLCLLFPLSFSVSFWFVSPPCSSSPRAWRSFAVLPVKRSALSSTKVRGTLCCFARKTSVRRHESTTIILVLRWTVFGANNLFSTI